MDMPLLKVGWIALYLSNNTIISTPPYFVFETKRICEQNIIQLATTANPTWTIECKRGTTMGPKTNRKDKQP